MFCFSILASVIQSNIRLFELHEEAGKSLKEGDSLTLIGEGKEDAVLCSARTTYSIKKVEMSNQMYLVSAAANSTGFQITGSANHFYEVRLWAVALLKPWPDVCDCRLCIFL